MIHASCAFRAGLSRRTPDLAHYTAPELCDKDRICTAKADVVSFAVILVEVLTLSPLFAATEPLVSVMRKLRAGAFPRLADWNGEMIQNLLGRCWSLFAYERPSFDESLQQLIDGPSQIVPGADLFIVSHYIQRILAWES
jgi:hypothetical protein